MPEAMPEASHKKGGRNMAYVINEGCVECGACAAQCPVGAISEGDGTYVIDPNECIECGACAAQCPMEVISEE